MLTCGSWFNAEQMPGFEIRESAVGSR